MYPKSARPSRLSVRLRTVGSIGVALGLVFGMSACSSDEEPDICTLSSELSSDANSKNIVAQTRRAATKMKNVEPPAEIEAEWKMFSDYFTAMAKELEGVPDDDREAYNAAEIKVGDALDGKEMSKASRKVTDYVDKNCGS